MIRSYTKYKRFKSLVDAKENDVERLPELNLPKLGIGKEHYEAIEKAVKDLGRQGLAIEIIKE